MFFWKLLDAETINSALKYFLDGKNQELFLKNTGLLEGKNPGFFFNFPDVKMH